VRFFIAAAAGSTVALLLFVLMNALISGEQTIDRSDLDGQIVDFIRMNPEEITQTKERIRPDEPDPPEDPPPPPPPMDVPESVLPTGVELAIELPDISLTSASGGGPYLGQWAPGALQDEGDVIPIVQLPPQYPRQAALDRIEGWVKLRFTILPDGTVADPVVLESMPRRTFDRSAITAILRWKFKPRISAGEAVAREAELTIDFTLPD